MVGDVGRRRGGVFMAPWHCGLNPCDPAVGNVHCWKSVEILVCFDVANSFPFSVIQ